MRHNIFSKHTYAICALIHLLKFPFACRSEATEATTNQRQYTRSAESLNLVPGEIGVEYKTSDHAICAKVHSVKQAESIRSASLRRPLDAFNKYCLFVYGVNDKKQNYKMWATKILNYDATDWRKHTTWFQSDLVRREIKGLEAFQSFVRACPMVDRKGKPTHFFPPRTTSGEATQPVVHTEPTPSEPAHTDPNKTQPVYTQEEHTQPADTQPAVALERPVCVSQEPVSPTTTAHTSDNEEL